MNEKIKEYKFSGVPIKCIYDTPDFKTYALTVNSQKYPDIQKNTYGNISIVGELPTLTMGVEYEITATEQISKYGVSYKVVNIKRELPQSEDDMYLFLEEILTPNQTATLWAVYPDIVERIKENRLDDIDFSKLKGIKEKTFEKIKDKIIENYCLVGLIAEFKGVISLNIIRKIYHKYSSIELLREKLKTEPYSTLTKISGVGFKTADSIVLQLQKENIIDFGYDVKTSPDRCLSCLLHLLQENENNGDTKMNLADLRKSCIQLVPECSDHFVEVVKSEDIYYNKDTMDVSLQKTYECEKYIADSIKYGLSINKKWNYDWKQYQNKGEFNLSDEQIELLHSVCENNIVILTGGAGMGKSASTKMLIRMLEDNNRTFVLAAPTGKSAKVLKDFSKTDAKTIHRALCFNPKTGWGYNKECKLNCDVFLIDELSMVSVELMTHIIDAIDFDKTKLVMIGDPNQLPSVQCGNILHDFLMSQIIPVVKLTKVFRYGTGGILTVATDIINSHKYIPDNKDKVLSFGKDNGYVFIKSDDRTIVDEAVALYKKLITTGIDGYIYQPEEIAVLTAYNKGDYGASVLNSRLQKIANRNYGSEKSMKCGDTIYHLGDIVMQKVNDYNMQVYDSEEEDAFVANGECSKVSQISKEFIVCDFDDVKIKYHKDKLQNLSLSYSYSIHKSQGSTIKIVILISPRSHIYMSTMNLLYVGITRASDKCFHFGLPSTINMAIKKKENFNRHTFMQNLLV